MHYVKRANFKTPDVALPSEATLAAGKTASLHFTLVLSVETDKVDSRKLAKELESGNLKAIYVPDQWNQQIRSLCRLRSKFVSHSTRLKNRIKGHLHFYGIALPKDEFYHWSSNFIKYLEGFCLEDNPAGKYLRFCIEEVKLQRARIVEITRSLRNFVKNSRNCASIINNIRSIPGIGFVGAVTLYTEIIDMNRFSNLDKLCSFVGLVPSCHSSGETEKICGITSRKNTFLRCLLIEASWVTIRNDPAMLKYYTKLTKRIKKLKQ